MQVRSTRPFFEDLVATTESLYSVGRNTRQDVLRAELELSRLDDRLIDIERHEAVARARLREWIGPAAGRPLVAELPAWNAVPVIDDLLERLEDHPELRAADAGLEYARLLFNSYIFWIFFAVVFLAGFFALVGSDTPYRPYAS